MMPSTAIRSALGLIRCAAPNSADERPSAHHTPNALQSSRKIAPRKISSSTVPSSESISACPRYSIQPRSDSHAFDKLVRNPKYCAEHNAPGHRPRPQEAAGPQQALRWAFGLLFVAVVEHACSDALSSALRPAETAEPVALMTASDCAATS